MCVWAALLPRRDLTWMDRSGSEDRTLPDSLETRSYECLVSNACDTTTNGITTRRE